MISFKDLGKANKKNQNRKKLKKKQSSIIFCKLDAIPKNQKITMTKSIKDNDDEINEEMGKEQMKFTSSNFVSVKETHFKKFYSIHEQIGISQFCKIFLVLNKKTQQKRCMKSINIDKKKLFRKTKLRLG